MSTRLIHRSGSVPARQRLLLVGSLVAALMISLMPPAAADGAGIGQFALTATGVNANPPCAEVTAMHYEGTFVGEVTVDNGSTTATYVGPYTIEFDTAETFYANPRGTFPDRTCGQVIGTGGDGHPVAIENVTIRTVRGDVDCIGGTGTFSRRDFVDGTTNFGGFTSCNVIPSGDVTPVGGVPQDSTIKHAYVACTGAPPLGCATTDVVQ